MQDAIRRDPHTTGGATGRCDGAVIRAWMEARYQDYKGESWSAFRERIQACGLRLSNGDSNKAIAVFTSATPVAILAAAALELSDEKLLSILGVIYNSGITVLRSRGDDLRLFTFNGTPHLDAQSALSDNACRPYSRATACSPGQSAQPWERAPVRCEPGTRGDST